MEQNNQGGRPERGPTIIAAAIVVSALVLGWSLKDDGPRYQLAGSGTSVVRMNSDSGEMIACDKASCNRIQLPDRARTFGPLRVEFGDGDKAGQVERDVRQQVNRDVQRRVEQETRPAVENETSAN